MRFCEALDDLLTVPDIRMRRAGWPWGQWLVLGGEGLLKQTLNTTGTAVISKIWAPAPQDMLSEDWVQVGEERTVDTSRSAAVIGNSTLFRDPASRRSNWP